MKKIILILLTLHASLFTLHTFSQGCLPEGITFNTQEQIDSFQVNYPGCSEVEGDVEIMGEDITNLNGLIVLNSISGTLEIQGSHSLVNLSGLDSINSINGSLIIWWNSLINNITALNNLNQVGDNLIIRFNKSLGSLTGLNNVSYVEGEIQIIKNEALLNLTGFENLSSIGGSLTINKNEALASLKGLENLSSIGGSLSITSNEVLSSLEGLNNIQAGTIENLIICYNDTLSTCNVESICQYLSSPGGEITIHDNETGCNNPGEIANSCGIAMPCLPNGDYWFTSQMDVDSFQVYYPGCTDLEGDVRISGENITNLIGLNVITSISGSLLIYGNESLLSLAGLENLTSVDSNLYVGLKSIESRAGYLFSGNPLLSDLQGLNNLAFVGGDVVVEGNESLVSLSGLENIPSVIRNLNVINNDMLYNLIGLDSITAIGGDFIIGSNTSLTSLSGLENLDSIDGSLELFITWPSIYGPYYDGNPSLLSLSSLSNLSYIGSDLKIIDNDTLLNLTGLDNLDFLGGNLLIGKNDNMTSLNGLENLQTIQGGISFGYYLYTNSTLTSLSGLDNLTSVGGDFFVDCNSVLTSLSGLENLSSIEGDLIIGENCGNSSLQNLYGLLNLESIGGSIRVFNNDALSSLTGLENIDASSIESLEIIANDSLSTCHVESVCDFLASPNGEITINGNASGCNNLQEVEEACGLFSCLPDGITFSSQEEIDNFLSNYIDCIEVEGDVEINGDDIDNLLGLSELTAIGGDFRILSNDALTSLEDMNGLTSIGGSLIIEDNPILTDIWGLVNIDPVSIEDLFIADNASLSICDIHNICDYLATPNGTVNIQNNAPGCNSPEEVEENCNHHCLPEGISFTTQSEIDNFQINNPNCGVIEGDLWIHGNEISNLNGLNVLTSIWGKLRISYNGSLTSLAGLNNVSYVGGNLEICNNYALTSLTGLDNINIISSMLQIEHNHSLTSLAGLDNLITTGGAVKIYDNDLLNNLSGLDNLTSIGGYLRINSNETLASLSGIENVNAGSIHGLVIKNNISLASCAAESICDYLAAPNGTIEISDNAPGCNSQEEVEDACIGVSIKELSCKDKFTISPNPTSGATHIRFTIYEPGFASCELFEISGIKLKSLISEMKMPGTHEVEIDLRDLPKGIYFCVLKTNSGTQTQKIIKR